MENEVLNAVKILRDYLKDRVNKSSNLEENFLDFITTISAIAATFAVLIPTLANNGTNLLCLILAEGAFLFSVISGIVIRWIKFSKDAVSIPQTIKKIVDHLTVLYSPSSTNEEKQAAINFANGDQVIDSPKKTAPCWVIIPLFIGIAMVILGFLVPLLEKANTNDSSNSSARIIFDHPKGSIEINNN